MIDPNLANQIASLRAQLAQLEQQAAAQQGAPAGQQAAPAAPVQPLNQAIAAFRAAQYGAAPHAAAPPPPAPVPAQPQLRVPPAVPLAQQAAPMQMQVAAAGRAPGQPLAGQNLTPMDQQRRQQQIARLMEARRAAIAGQG